MLGSSHYAEVVGWTSPFWLSPNKDTLQAVQQKKSFFFYFLVQYENEIKFQIRFLWWRITQKELSTTIQCKLLKTYCKSIYLQVFLFICSFKNTPQSQHTKHSPLHYSLQWDPFRHKPYLQQPTMRIFGVKQYHC